MGPSERTYRFFLTPTEAEGNPELLPGEVEHARRVLRLGPGARCQGIDGQGRRWPMRVVAGDRSAIRIVATGPPEQEPAPGEAGSELPWIELLVAWPKKARAEEMIGTLVQLGVAAITPLQALQAGPVPPPPTPPERWFKLAREACKQSGRGWMPRFSGSTSLGPWLESRSNSPLGLLDPRGGMGIDTWLRSLNPAPVGVGTRERPIALIVGPEGGFTPEETERLHFAGASPLQVGPHILRIETAAVAAMSVAAATFHAARPRG